MFDDIFATAEAEKQAALSALRNELVSGTECSLVWSSTRLHAATQRLPQAQCFMVCFLRDGIWRGGVGVCFGVGAFGWAG
jgi:hypothetical protein